MGEKKQPRLRTVDKVKPPYPLNNFPKNFGLRLGREIIYLLATKGRPVLKGEEWEEIFSLCIDGIWKPSNVGLDDITLDCCAWGAKTIIAAKPSKIKRIRLISGRNSPTYSFGVSKITSVNPNGLGGKILSIWNERVSAIRKTHKHVRTVVLIKSKTLDEVAVFEFDTIRYEDELYSWKWNKNDNLEGFQKSTGFHKFTWQPHGSQFTVIEKVPSERLVVNVKIPKKLDKSAYLKGIGFQNNWVSVSKQSGG